MKRDISRDAKIGIFILILLGVLAYITIDVSNLAISPGATYTVYSVLKNAEGITKKTPVQIAGIPVGVVSEIELIDYSRARIGMKIKKNVRVTEDMTVTVRTRGVLGDVYLELIPGAPDSPPLRAGESFERVETGGDYQDIFKNTAEITKDLKEITEALKSYTVADKSMVANILKNMEVLTTNMASFSTKNAENMNVIVANLAALSQDLRHISSESGMDVEATLKRINAITEKIEKGEGTLGKLIVEEDTVEKTNTILDDLKTLTEPIGRLKVGLDYHLEYLGASQEYKNIVNFKLSTRPDKYFLFGVMHNTNPPPSTSTEIETFDTDGTTTVVTKETSSFDKIRFNAQLAKVFKDFTIRGGLIENTGGVAAEYNKGPFNVTVQGFNFGNPGQSLKVSGYLNLTNSIYVTGGGYFLGGTDSVSGITYGNDWFVGAGLRFTDEDISSLLGGVGLVVP